MQSGILTNPLLSDDEWAELLAAEYAASGRRLDDVTAARIWKKTERAIREVPRPSGFRELAGPLAMAALLLVGVLSFLSKGLTGPSTGIKGAGEPYAGQPVSLVVYQMTAGGALEPFYSSDPRVGQTLVFKTMAPEDGVVALLMAEGQDAPVVRFVGSHARGGDEQLLERAGRAYGFTLGERQVTPLRFCVVAEANAARLAALLQDPEGLWQVIDPGACVQVSSLGGR